MPAFFTTIVLIALALIPTVVRSTPCGNPVPVTTTVTDLHTITLTVTSVVPAATVTQTVTAPDTTITVYKPWGAPTWGAGGPTVTVTKTESAPNTAATNGSSTTKTTSSLGPAASEPAKGGQCNTGTVQCCSSLQKAENPDLWGLGGVAAFIGAAGTCSPLTIGGTHCNSQPVCCENNTYNGVVVLACDPVNVNL